MSPRKSARTSGSLSVKRKKKREEPSQCGGLRGKQGFLLGPMLEEEAGQEKASSILD
jgi:hypothetical protein